MSLFDKFQTTATQYKALREGIGRDPFGVSMDEMKGPTRAMVNGKEIVLAGTNNYLGLTYDDRAIAAAKDAIDQSGTGTTGSRFANGTYAAHRQLEIDLAAFLGFKHCMVFSTGYQANLGAISALAAPPEDVILLDADCHACIYDGAQLSGAEIIRFRHNDPESLDKRLGRLGDKVKGKLVCFEGMYSMFGDIAPVKELIDVAHKHGAYALLDEAHSFGVFGDNGRGVCEAEGVLDDVDFYTGTFSKSLASIGGFVASNHPELEYLRFSSRPYMFTASPSPANVATASAALARLKSDPSMRENLWQNAKRVHAAFTQLGFDLCAPESPVIAARLEGREQAFMAWNFLMENGVYVNLAIPPGTPNATSILRLSVSAAHTNEDLDAIINAYTALSEMLSAQAA
ncbi:MAG: aminotransferase class I/II-fold pyridoxal phosphate-dependent enzyme [Alphaproteobacteria bacterium]|nr:aminotransferase class I/II-fold pyridoxal phosphate-dependent enzyme [Alphaproteobacteria bacterium]